MCVLVYCDPADPSLQDLLDAVGTRIPESRRVIFATQKETLVRDLSRHRFEQIFLVLMVRTPAQLTELIAIKHLFEGIPVILIVPDSSAPGFERRFDLYARYIADARDGFWDVAMVLEKIVKRGDEGMAGIKRAMRPASETDGSC